MLFLFSLAGLSSISAYIFAASLRRCSWRFCAAAGGVAGTLHKSPQMPQNGVLGLLSFYFLESGPGSPNIALTGVTNAYLDNWHFVMILDCSLDGEHRKYQIAISNLTISALLLCRLRENQSFVLQFPHIFPYSVLTHVHRSADSLVARPALM